MPKATAVFAIDGFEVSATFAESQNTAAIGQVKQILLSSFAAQTSPQPSKAILVKSSKQRDNILFLSIYRKRDCSNDQYTIANH